MDGRVRLVEGLAMPHEEDEFRLSYYNSMTTWIRVSRLLDLFGLRREDLRDAGKVKHAVRRLAGRLGRRARIAPAGGSVASGVGSAAP